MELEGVGKGVGGGVGKDGGDEDVVREVLVETRRVDRLGDREAGTRGQGDEAEAENTESVGSASACVQEVSIAKTRL